MLEIKPWWAMYKVSALLDVLSLWPKTIVCFISFGFGATPQGSNELKWLWLGLEFLRGAENSAGV